MTVATRSIAPRPSASWAIHPGTASLRRSTTRSSGTSTGKAELPFGRRGPGPPPGASRRALCGLMVRRANIGDELVAILIQPAHKLSGGRGFLVVFQAPTDQFDHDRQQVEGLCGGLVNDPPWL